MKLNKETLLFYLFALYIDEYSCQLDIEDDDAFTKSLYRKARQLHLDMIDFLGYYDKLNTTDTEYYDFFFKFCVKEHLTLEELLNKFLKEQDDKLRKSRKVKIAVNNNGLIDLENDSSETNNNDVWKIYTLEQEQDNGNSNNNN